MAAQERKYPMAKVNYIRECRAFTMLAAEERLTANEFVLWHALFELFNRKAEGDEWPDGFVQISSARLLALTTYGVGDSGCETLRKTREKLQARGLIRYRKGRRGALTPEYSLCYFFAEKSEPAGNAETPVITRLESTVPERRTGKLLGKPLGRPLGKPLGKPLGIPLNVNLNVNPNLNPGHTQFLTGGTNPRASEGQRQTHPVDDAVSRQPNEAREGRSEHPQCGIKRTDSPMNKETIKECSDDDCDHCELRGCNHPAKQGAGKGYDYAELSGHTDESGYDLGWKTSARARGAVAQRLLDKYDGLLDTKDAWGDLCEVMADGLDPGTIERVMPTRPAFSRLIARLRALASAKWLGYPDGQGMQNAPRAGP